MNNLFSSVAVWCAIGFLSLFGGVALFAYAIHRRDPVFAVGQGLGLIVYARNLVLHRAPQTAIS